MMLIVSLGFLACLILQDVLCILCFSLFFIVYLQYRFQKRAILILFAIFSVFSILVCTKEIRIPENGEYQIVEIKNQYYVASNSKDKVLLYSDLDLAYYDTVLLSKFEPIHTDDNFTLFSFTKYCHQKGMDYQAKTYKVVSYSTSLKSKLYRYISKQKKASTYKSLYYGIHDESIDEIYTTLGCGFISAYYGLVHIVKRFWNEKKSRIFLWIVCVFYGYFFVASVALIRFILYQMMCILFSDKEKQIAFTIFLFGLILPRQVLSISFMLPLLLQLASFFCKKNQWIVQKVILLSCMFLYFKKINVVSFFLFNIIRKLYGVFFLFGFLFTIQLPNFTLYYAPSYLFLIGFIGFYILSLKHFRMRYLLFLGVIFLEIFANPFFQVYTLNIGQGDCTLIVEPYRKSVVMIDCGQSRYRDNVEKIIYPFLENKNIHTIDALVLTHSDFDHSGGYEALKEKVKIKQVVTKSSQKVNVSYPFYNLLVNREAQDENDQSIINYFTYDTLTYLFMGDASQNVEKQLLQTYDLKCDVLKVGHHGSNTSSSYAFLDQLDCKVALISAGYKNKYKHPSLETLIHLNSLYINSLCTSTSGSIGIYSLGPFSFFITNDGMFGII